MKLKYEFIICSTKDAEVAVAIGEGSMLFNGMIKLNKSGKFIFENRTLFYGKVYEN